MRLAFFSPACNIICLIAVGVLRRSHADCLFAPATQGFDHECDENHAHRQACLIVGGHLPLLPNSQRKPLSRCCTGQGEGLQSGDHRHVKGSRTSPTPIGEENVSRSTAGSQDQVWHFFPWSESSRLCSREEGVPKAVVSVDTVSVSPTAHLVVSKRVCGSLSHTGDILTLHHSSRELVMGMKISFRWLSELSNVDN